MIVSASLPGGLGQWRVQVYGEDVSLAAQCFDEVPKAQQDIVVAVKVA